MQRKTIKKQGKEITFVLHSGGEENAFYIAKTYNYLSGRSYSIVKL
jgi:peptidase E